MEEVPEEYKSKSGVYLIRCLVNGKVYIGSAVNMCTRWSVHRCLLNQNKHKNWRLQKEWNEYGCDQFTWEVLEYVYNLRVLAQVEDEYITRYKSNDKRFGFNSRLAGLRYSEETRRKIGEANRGKKHSEETKRKMSEDRRGKPQMKLRGQKKSEEHKQKLREANIGKKASEETRRKMSKSQLGNERPEETRARGENHGMAKTTWLEVREIRAKHASGKYTQTEIASEYELNNGTISRIVNNETWIEDEVA